MALHFLSHAQQLAAHLRSEILQGKWSDSMPGILLLEKELGVNRNTIDAALKLLEKEGLLKGQGAGRKRRIVLQENHTTPALQVICR
jgi:DNA-binding GntR family transcriptional regulator